jgi:asparagine synthase (glutamine-hydrolysing)
LTWEEGSPRLVAGVATVLPCLAPSGSDVCGIGGAIGVGDSLLLDRFASAVIERLAHRGPDDSDTARLPGGILAHRRLSILDPTPAGHQPFASSDGRFVLIHNGEIYNYLELRGELAELGHHFRTETDTEVIVEAYAEWGTDAIVRFNGIWAFALWDRKTESLLLSRDRLGVKPLYLGRMAGGWAFASEIKALRGFVRSAGPNLSALRDYAIGGWLDHSDATFYEGVEPLPPATNFLVEAGSTRRWRYWSPPESSGDTRPASVDHDEELVASFTGLLRDSVALQLRSDVPLGSCLSGGIDSAAIVSLSSELVRDKLGPHGAAPRIALTASFPGAPDDETEAAALVASRAGVAHLRVSLEPVDLLETLETVMREQDEPFASASILAQRAVMESARAQGIKVMLDGQGADEMLGGYPHYRYAWLLGLLTGHPAAVPGALREMRRAGVPPSASLRQAALDHFRLGPTGRAPFGRDARVPSWVGPNLRTAAPLPLREPGEPVAGTPLARHLVRALVATSLPALLRYEDRNSMRFGVEARVPYLDHRLVEAACLLPDRLRISHAMTKVVLRRGMAGIVPDEIRLDRRKIGFAVPQAAWLASSMPALRGFLAAPRASAEGVMDPRPVAALLDRPLNVDGAVELWRALSIEMWLRTFD